MTEKILCDIYKSLKHEGMYLFLDSREGFSRVPDTLLNTIGKTAKVTTLAVTPERKLARAKAKEVLLSIRDKGFYLQLPPTRDQQMDEQMQAMVARNEKLPG